MFMEMIRPWKYYKDVFSISYEELIKNGYDSLLFDIDNTLVNNYVKDVDYRIKELFSSLKQKGFKIYLVSNSLPIRVHRIARSLGVKGYSLAFKPNIVRTMNTILKHHLEKERTILIGDQIFSDILCANRIGIKSILVDPIDVHEPFITIMKRGRESEFINRGDYFE